MNLKLLRPGVKLRRINTNWAGCKIGDIVIFQSHIKTGQHVSIMVKDYFVPMDIENFELVNKQESHLPDFL